MKFNKKFLQYLLLIFFISILIYFIKNNYDVFLKIKNINILEFFILSLSYVLFLRINGIFFDILSRNFNIKVKENFLLSIVTSFINLFTPFIGGMGFRAWYTKKKYGLNYSYFSSCILGNYIIVFMVSSILGLAIFIYIYFSYGVYNIIFILLFLLIFFGSLFFIIFNKIKLNYQGKIFLTINRIIEGRRIISQDKETVYKLVILQFVNILIGVAQIYTIFYFINYPISFFEAFYISIISILAIFIKITPGNLGVTELLYIGSAGIVGVPAEIMLLVSLIKRAIEMAVLLILGPITNYILIKKSKEIS